MVIDFLKLSLNVIENKPDCIYERYNLFFPSGIWVKKIFRIPLILEVNAPLYEERKKHGSISLNRLALWTERYVWKNADYILPVTDVLADWVRAEKVSEDKTPQRLNEAGFFIFNIYILINYQKKGSNYTPK